MNRGRRRRLSGGNNIGLEAPAVTAYKHTPRYDMPTALLLREFANVSVCSVILSGCSEDRQHHSVREG